MRKIIAWWGVSTLAVVTAWADTTGNLETKAAYNTDLSYESPFQSGKWELGVNSGIMFSPFFDLVTHRVVDYTITGIQGGIMMSDPMGRSFWRGNFEFIAEVFGGGVVEGEGSYIAGLTGYFRYNFLPRDSRLKPYAQLGAGTELTDIDTHLLGQRQNFNVCGGLGVRYMFTPRCALNVEYRFQHLSDLDQTKVNLGVNAQGLVLGVSWFF